MSNINTELKLLLKNQVVHVATTDIDGYPEVSLKRDVVVIDDNHLILSGFSSRSMQRNLRKNPLVTLTVFDPVLNRGCQIKGRAEIIETENIVHTDGRYVRFMRHPRDWYSISVEVDEVSSLDYNIPDAGAPAPVRERKREYASAGCLL